MWRSRHHRRLCRRLRLRRDRRATGAVSALDCVDGRGIAGATTTEDPATMTSKQSVGLLGRGGDDDDVVDPRGDSDNDTTISLAMATATRVEGDEEVDGGKSDDDYTNQPCDGDGNEVWRATKSAIAARAMATMKRVAGERRQRRRQRRRRQRGRWRRRRGRRRRRERWRWQGRWGGRQG